MESHKYIARKRARFKGLSGNVNIPYGSLLESRGGFLFYKDVRLCTVTSQNAYDFFSVDDDGRGLERGGLVAAIMARLEKRDGSYRARWNKVWGAPVCQRYRHPEHDDFWIWNQAFYEAPVEDLQAIAKLVGAKVR